MGSTSPRSNVRTARRDPAAARSSRYLQSGALSRAKPGGAVLTPTSAEHPCRSLGCPATRGCLPGEGLSFLPRPTPLQIRLTSLHLVSVSASMQRLVLARPVRRRASLKLAVGISHGAAGPTPCNIGSAYANLTMPSGTLILAPFIAISPRTPRVIRTRLTPTRMMVWPLATPGSSYQSVEIPTLR